MVAVPEIRAESEFEDYIQDKSWYEVTAELTRKYPLGAFGAVVVVVMIVLAVFANVLSPYDPEANAFEVMLTPPNLDFWLGTDQFGRDILTRIIYGSRTALFVGFSCAFIGAVTGLILGGLGRCRLQAKAFSRLVPRIRLRPELRKLLPLEISLSCTGYAGRARRRKDRPRNW